MSQPFSVYIHIPFCYQKCPYCDFNTYAVANPPEEQYVGGLKAEIDYYAANPLWKGRSVQTIYFGGGTPSILSPRLIRHIISTITSNFNVLPFAEVCIEANPCAISMDALMTWYESGINRLSLGAQSFASNILRTLGRTHTSEQIHAAITSARAANFKNISIDLMVGVPGQTIHDVRNDVEQCLDIDIPHVSMYSLTIEKGTPFYQSKKRGILKLPQDESVLEMISTIDNTLQLGGLNRYEISNFAKPGFESRHNLAYWNQDDYLGIGAGAHSYCKQSVNKTSLGTRWSNFAFPQKYIESTTSTGFAQSWSEELSLKSAIFEFFFLGLRKINGVSLKYFEFEFKVSIDSCYGDLIDILTSEGWLVRNDDFIALSTKGINVADSIIENFCDPNI